MPSRRWDANYVFPVNLDTEVVIKAITEGIESRKTRTVINNSGQQRKRSQHALPTPEFCIVPGTITGEMSRSVFDIDSLGTGGVAVSEMQLPAVKVKTACFLAVPSRFVTS